MKTFSSILFFSFLIYCKSKRTTSCVYSLTLFHCCTNKRRLFKDTVVALQALATYSLRTYNKEVNFDLELRMEDTPWIHKTTITNENTDLQRIIRNVGWTMFTSNYYQVYFYSLTKRHWNDIFGLTRRTLLHHAFDL